MTTLFTIDEVSPPAPQPSYFTFDEVARAYLEGAGMTLLGELAKVTGLSRVDAGLGNHALVDEGFAVRVERGVYRLADFEERVKRL